MNKRSTLAFTLAAATTGLAWAAPAATAPAHTHGAVIAAATVASQAKVETTKAALRDLWIGHVFWTRNVVVAAFAGNASAKQAAESEVLANAGAIAGAIEPFYGAAAKKQLLDLLAGHYGAVRAYLDASLARNEKQKGAASSQLLDNAGKIAAFLSSANPNLAKDTLGELLQAHGGHHIAQIQQLQAKDYKGEAQTWAEMSQHMYVLSDALADGRRVDARQGRG